MSAANLSLITGLALLMVVMGGIGALLAKPRAADSRQGVAADFACVLLIGFALIAGGLLCIACSPLLLVALVERR